METDEALDDRKAEPDPTTRSAAGHGGKPVEDRANKVSGDAGATVGHDDLDGIPVSARQEADAATFRRKLNGVGKQIVDDLAQPLLIGDHTARLRRYIHVKSHAALAEAIADAIDSECQSRGHVDFSQIQIHDAGVDAREIENVVDDRQKGRAR